MNEHTQRLTAVEGRLDRVEEQLTTEKAERLALQQIVVPPLTQVRQDLQLNIDFLTMRLEQLKARPAGGADSESAEDIVTIYEGLLQLLRFENATYDQLQWLVGIVGRSMERQNKLLGALGGPQAA